MTETAINIIQERTRLQDVLSELTRPFPPEDIKWRVQTYNPKSGKALLVPYLDARHIQERLDEVVPGEWELRFRRETLEGPAYIAGHVVYASMSICGVTREDVGSAFIANKKDSNSNDEEGFDKLNENKLDPKTATSDSIKRVAAQFGIGRYLWNMDKPVFIDAKDDKGKNKYQWSPPKHDAVPKHYHDYLYNLGLQAHSSGASSSIEVVKYILRQVSDGTVSAENMLQYFDSKGEAVALASIISRMQNEGK